MHADDAAVVVDVDEAARVAREPRRGRALERWQRDDEVGGQPLAAAELERAVDDVARRGASAERDPRVGEQRGDLGAGRDAEDLERPSLGRHDGQLEALLLAAAAPVGGHQGELVDRQRPGRRGRHGEDNAAARSELAEAGRDRWASWGPRNASAPSIARRGRAPSASSRWSYPIRSPSWVTTWWASASTAASVSRTTANPRSAAIASSS